MLDVFWGEDSSRKRIACAAANFGTVLRIAHNLVKTHPENISIKRKRKKADRSDYYREQILRLQTWKQISIRSNVHAFALWGGDVLHAGSSNYPSFAHNLQIQSISALCIWCGRPAEDSHQNTVLFAWAALTHAKENSVVIRQTLPISFNIAGETGAVVIWIGWIAVSTFYGFFHSPAKWSKNDQTGYHQHKIKLFHDEKIKAH